MSTIGANKAPASGGGQTFVGDEWQWVRFDKALTPEQAEEMFKHFSRIAPTHGYCRVQIRHGRD